MFDVLMYLFETYIHNEAEMRVDQDKLTQDLTDAGFEREDIYNALMWLEKLADYQKASPNRCSLLLTHCQYAFIPRKSVKGWTRAAGGSSYSLSRFRC